MKAKIQFIIAMFLFGSIGLFVKNISLDSATIVQWRTIIGSILLIGYFVIKKQGIDLQNIKKDWIPLFIAGIAIGGNWALLFEAYKRTSVGMATAFYYMAPIFVFILSPILFKEKITKYQIWGIISAIVGMGFINLMGVIQGNITSAFICGLGAAVLYATVMVMNKFIRHIDGVQSTLIQLLIATLVMTIYCYLNTGQILSVPQKEEALFVIIVGVIHTGLALTLYFSAMQKLSPQNIAVFSYIDPAVALIFSFIFLKEAYAWYQIIGAVFIFGGTIVAQMGDKKLVE